MQTYHFASTNVKMTMHKKHLIQVNLAVHILKIQNVYKAKDIHMHACNKKTV